MQILKRFQVSSLFPPLPSGFLTLYDGKTGVEIFDVMVLGLLEMLAKALMAWNVPALSPRCFHQWGGAKMILRGVKAWRKALQKATQLASSSALNEVRIILTKKET